MDSVKTDTNIDVRSIPSRSTFKIPMLPGKNKILTDMPN